MKKKNYLFVFALTLCAFISTTKVEATPLDTGLGNNYGGAIINNTTGGFQGMTQGNHSATLEFTSNSHVNWDTLNLNRGETLNFNAINGTNGLTIINTVTNGMSNIHGNINANSGISNLIISNPNGMLYDGAHFTTTGDVMLTTQPLNILDLTNLMIIKE